MLTDEILQPFQNIQEILNDIVNRLNGFLFLGDVPEGDLGGEFVYITELKNGNTIVFPFEVDPSYEPELYADTTKNTRLEIQAIQGNEVVISPDSAAKLRSVGEKRIVYVARIKKRSDNLWKSYGRFLYEIFHPDDTPGYKDLLLQFLRYYVLGPTVEGAEGILGAEVVDDRSAEQTDWWEGLILPTTLVEVKDGIPKIGVDLTDGVILPQNNPLNNEGVLSRVAKNFGEAYFDQPYPLHFQGDDDPITYVFDGKTQAYRIFENVLRYNTFIVYLPALSSGREWRARVKALNEGRPTHTLALVIGRADLIDTLSNHPTEDLTLEGHTQIDESFPDWVFDSPQGYRFDALAKEHAATVYSFDEGDLFFDSGRFVRISPSGVVEPRPTEYLFNEPDLIFDSGSVRFDSREGLTLIGTGFIRFDNVQREEEEISPYKFDIPPTFYDSTEVKNVIDLHDTLEQHMYLENWELTVKYRGEPTLAVVGYYGLTSRVGGLGRDGSPVYRITPQGVEELSPTP